MEALLGRPREEILRSALDSEFIQQDPEWVQAQFARVLHEGHWSGELTVRRSDGNIIPVDVIATRIDQSSKPLVLAAIRNISERKRSELALTAQARRSAVRADVGAALENSGAAADVLQRAAEALAQDFSGAHVSIWIQQNETSPFDITAQAGAAAQECQYPDSIARIAARGQPEISDRSVRLPLQVESRVIGVLEIAAASALDSADIETLAAVAEGVAQFEERKRARDALELRVAEHARTGSAARGFDRIELDTRHARGARTPARPDAQRAGVHRRRCARRRWRELQPIGAKPQHRPCDS
jgi:PAS domain S-box-containing protein